MTHRALGLAVVVTVSAGVGTSCSADSNPPSDHAAARSSVLDLRATGCGALTSFGTATLVRDGHAVTAAHVVAGADEVHVIDRSGVEHRVDVVSFDPDLDVAVLSTPPDLGTPIEIAADPARPGERGVVAFARRVDGEVVTRVIDVDVIRHVNIDTTDIYLDADVTRPGFEIEAVIDPGDSGGVVVIDGRATGIIWARSNARLERAWAVDIPDAVRDENRLAAMNDAVDTGPCP